MNEQQPPHAGASSAHLGTTAHRDLAYIANGHARQKLDLYLPSDGIHFPLIIWVHGGAFRMGSKEGLEFDPVPLDYLAQGYAVASLNYRLSQHALFPAQIEDCKAAVRWLRAHAQQFNLNSLHNISKLNNRKEREDKKAQSSRSWRSLRVVQKQNPAFAPGAELLSTLVLNRLSRHLVVQVGGAARPQSVRRRSFRHAPSL